MKHRDIALKELSEKSNQLSSLSALVGFDGFIDRIMNPVDKRQGPGDAFVPMEQMTDFAKRVSDAAGKSTNIEIYPRMEKIGGNGPILANALLNAGLKTRYVGALGVPAVAEVFKDFAEASEAVSIANPGVTHALEFNDGKLMLGDTSPLDEITYDKIISEMGEGAFFDAMSRANLIAIINWTMTPHLTGVLETLVDKVLPNLGPLDKRQFFFDLCDPAKRADGDILAMLSVLRKFMSFGKVTLGLNLAEAQTIYRVIGKSAVEPDKDGLRKMARTICQTLELSMVVIHPVDCAVCATRDEDWWTDGPYCKKPLITTGAGDHFNGGFALGQLLGLSPKAALTLGVAFSGSYVRTAQSPSLSQAETFIRTWTEGN